MKNLFSLLLVGLLSCPTFADTYIGTWVTKNRPLGGNMTCETILVTDGTSSYEIYAGKFYGTWQGVDFSYDVKWLVNKEGKAEGTAVIDGANYKWVGGMDKKRFYGYFDGDRYNGNFDLRRKEDSGRMCVTQ